MLINETEGLDGFKMFLRGRKDEKTLLSRVWECLEFVIAGWFKVKVVDLTI